VTQYQAIFSWIESQGGVTSIVEKFRANGLGEIVSSWLSSGQNLPISAEQITAIFGSPAVQELASKLGIDIGSASALIAEYLPKIVDSVSPDGQEPQPGEINLMSQGLDFLKKFNH
jgi:uncharacterized protein YidB (DUF937 family)